jgi:hypothetical protein
MALEFFGLVLIGLTMCATVTVNKNLSKENGTALNAANLALGI